MGKLGRALLAVIVPALLVAASGAPSSVSAQKNRPPIHSSPAAQSPLIEALASNDEAAFTDGVRLLLQLDEPGVNALWRIALGSPEEKLRRIAWREYDSVRVSLSRKESVPQVVRVGASGASVKNAAARLGLDATVWSEAGDESVVAAPPYLVEHLRSGGAEVEVLYDTIAAWQRARSGNDGQATSIQPPYFEADQNLNVRIAVVERLRRLAPRSGHSEWLGDRENILLQSDAYLAYLDIFPLTGEESVADHIERAYTLRGYQLAGFFKLEEFESLVGVYFPGQGFDAGRGEGRGPGTIEAQLAEGQFHSYDETLAEFNQLATDHPDIARVVTLGMSYEGRMVFALKVTKGAAVNDSSKPDVLFTGCHHAREWISVEPPVYFANQLVKNYATDDRIRHHVDRLNIWIVPIVNPDGLTYSQGSANEKVDAVRLWRKNRRPVELADCGVSGVGVDLNRNYDFGWRLPGDLPCNTNDDLGGSDHPLAEVFRGKEPASEPEIRALLSLTDDPNRNFRARADYHNYSQMILYPWGHKLFGTPDDKLLSDLAASMADDIRIESRKVYRPDQAIGLYSTTGSSVDYAYGVNKVAAPFLVEMEPTCCGFNVKEGDIDGINRQNWAAARRLLDWAVGPPILETVKAYQKAPDGNFSKIVYSARWAVGEAEAEARRLIVDTRFPGVEPGPLLVRLQFSKPMSPAHWPTATLGRDGFTDELRLTPVDMTQGWQKTVYDGDTWIGEVVLPNEEDGREWQIAVASLDINSLELDAMPETLAFYATGSGGWSGYENFEGLSGKGGTDLKHVLPPIVTGGMFEMTVASPEGGERLAAGDVFTVAWTVPRGPHFNPGRHQVRLSTDGGFSYEPIAEASGDVDEQRIVVPFSPTTRGRTRVLAFDSNNSSKIIFGTSREDFTIGMNVGGGIRVESVSSELEERNWTDTDPNGDVVSGPLRLRINLRVINTGEVPIANPFLRVTEIKKNNLLLSRDARSAPAAAARQSVILGGDEVLAPSEEALATLVVGLRAEKKFKMFLTVYGVPVGGQAGAGEVVRVWKGKPKTK